MEKRKLLEDQIAVLTKAIDDNNEHKIPLDKKVLDAQKLIDFFGYELKQASDNGAEEIAGVQATFDLAVKTNLAAEILSEQTGVDLPLYGSGPLSAWKLIRDDSNVVVLPGLSYDVIRSHMTGIWGLSTGATQRDPQQIYGNTSNFATGTFAKQVSFNSNFATAKQIDDYALIIEVLHMSSSENVANTGFALGAAEYNLTSLIARVGADSRRIQDSINSAQAEFDEAKLFADAFDKTVEGSNASNSINLKGAQDALRALDNIS